jgi:ribosome-associated translation inhibitor RaiA
MQIPLQISFKNMDPSPAVEARIRAEAKKLDRFYDRILGCQVIVDKPHRHQRQGRLYSIAVNISVPGNDLRVDRAGPYDPAHEDINVAIRDAFDAAGRQVADHAGRQRDAAKPARPD